MASGLLGIKEHSRRKYRILRKYIDACKIFSKKYQNFAYVDTHGGTGKVIDLDTNQKENGSTRIAGSIKPNFPCHSIEINPDRYELLESSTKSLPNVNTYHGDCNELIDEIIDDLPEGKFVLFFVDPDGLVYQEGNFTCHQIKSETIDKIVNFKRSEILLNLPLYTISRLAGYVKGNPGIPSAETMGRRITNFYGTESWRDIDTSNYQDFLRLFISEKMKGNFNSIGAILIRSEVNNAPLYYLVFGSRHEVGGKIMRSNMKIEWLDMRETEPISKHQYETDEEWLDSEFPTDMFIFEV